MFARFIGADEYAAGPGPALLTRARVMSPPRNEGRVDGCGAAESGRTKLLVVFLSVSGCKEVEEGRA